LQCIQARLREKKREEERKEGEGRQEKGRLKRCKRPSTPEGERRSDLTGSNKAVEKGALIGKGKREENN